MSCCSSTSPRRTTTAASSPSARTGACTRPRRRRRRIDPDRARQDTEELGSASSWSTSTRRVRLARSVDRPAQSGAFAFDPALGEVWIGDVGQDDVEEVNRVLLEPDEPPKNLGWDAFEGERRAEGDDALDRTVSWSGRSPIHARGRLLGHRWLRLPGHEAERSRAATSTATSAEARCGRSRARRRAAPRRPTRARSGATAHPHRPRRRRRAGVRLRGGSDLPRGHRRADPARACFTGPSIQTRTRSPGCHAGKPSRGCARAARWQLELEELVVAVERACRPRRASACAAGAAPSRSPPTPGAAPHRRSPPARRHTEAAELAVHDPALATPGSTSASPRNSASQRLRGPLVDLLRGADLLDPARRA